ncbi:hypothetical protein J4E81_010727 [Alternaria sp. BMP 2799]|nr:hypothetical protein J4E81_010727 [Alternaria sp. BMP 2799]
MDRLSTELDEKIIQQLVGKEASALSMTSKYYRSLAEPQLYRELDFSTKQYTSIMLLFDTLVDRQDLARHIRSFVLTNTGVSDTTPGFDDMFFLRLSNKFDAFKQIIDQAVPPESRELATRWRKRVFVGAPVIDGQIAVILSLAKNLEHLRLVTTRLDWLPVTKSVAGLCWIKGRMTGMTYDGTVISWELIKDTT